MNAMRLIVLLSAIFAVGLTSFAPTDADAFGDGKRKKGRMGKMGAAGGMGAAMTAKQPREFYEEKGLFATGLEPIFPAGLSCPGIASPFGSQTRYDGSWRNNSFHGYHNGMDISLETGTPLISIADGEVIHAGMGGMLVGSFVWTRHAPEDTGLPFYLFVRYQHLDIQSPLTAGDKVAMGQTLGPSGRTGTQGGHYGDAGYPHLHMNLMISNSAEFEIEGSMIKPNGFNFLDPVGLFAPKDIDPLDNHVLKALPDDRKRLPVAVKGPNGDIVPPGAKIIWPVGCTG